MSLTLLGILKNGLVAEAGTVTGKLRGMYQRVRDPHPAGLCEGVLCNSGASSDQVTDIDTLHRLGVLRHPS